MDKIEKLKVKADKGNSNAQFYLGLMYRYGQVVDKDIRLAAKYFKMAAKQGDIEALIYLGKMYYHRPSFKTSVKDLEKWRAKAAEYFARAAAKGSAIAAHKLGLMFYLGKGFNSDKKLAASWFMLANSKNYAPSQYETAEMYRKGENCKDGKSDYTKAFEFFNLAACQGHTEAQYSLGLMFYNGNEHVKIDHNQAFIWYKKAADKGHTLSQIALGLMCRRNYGGARDNADCVVYAKNLDRIHRDVAFKTGNIKEDYWDNYWKD